MKKLILIALILCLSLSGITAVALSSGFFDIPMQEKNPKITETYILSIDDGEEPLEFWIKTEYDDDQIEAIELNAGSYMPVLFFSDDAILIDCGQDGCLEVELNDAEDVIDQYMNSSDSYMDFAAVSEVNARLMNLFSSNMMVQLLMNSTYSEEDGIITIRVDGQMLYQALELLLADFFKDDMLWDLIDRYEYLEMYGMNADDAREGILELLEQLNDEEAYSKLASANAEITINTNSYLPEAGFYLETDGFYIDGTLYAVDDVLHLEGAIAFGEMIDGYIDNTVEYSFKFLPKYDGMSILGKFTDCYYGQSISMMLDLNYGDDGFDADFAGWANARLEALAEMSLDVKESPVGEFKSMELNIRYSDNSYDMEELLAGGYFLNAKLERIETEGEEIVLPEADLTVTMDEFVESGFNAYYLLDANSKQEDENLDMGIGLDDMHSHRGAMR